MGHLVIDNKHPHRPESLYCQLKIWETHFDCIQSNATFPAFASFHADFYYLLACPESFPSEFVENLYKKGKSKSQSKKK